MPDWGRRWKKTKRLLDGFNRLMDAASGLLAIIRLLFPAWLVKWFPDWALVSLVVATATIFAARWAARKVWPAMTLPPPAAEPVTLPDPIISPGADRPVALPKPKPKRKVEAPTRRTEGKFNIPSYVGRNADFREVVPFEGTWRWEGDDIMGMRIGCPNCGTVVVPSTPSHLPPGHYETVLRCPNCAFEALVTGSLTEILQWMEQQVYAEHRNHGLL